VVKLQSDGNTSEFLEALEKAEKQLEETREGGATGAERFSGVDEMSGFLLGKSQKRLKHVETIEDSGWNMEGNVDSTLPRDSSTKK